MKKHRSTPRRKRESPESPVEQQERIRRRAYEIYELRGRESGRDFDDWLQAESEVTRKADQR